MRRLIELVRDLKELPVTRTEALRILARWYRKEGK
jgi:hypothetical protein